MRQSAAGGEIELQASSHSASVPRSAMEREPPELLIRISSWPKRPSTAAWTLYAMPSDVISSTMARGRWWPWPAMALATASSKSAQRQAANLGRQMLGNGGAQADADSRYQGHPAR